VGITCTEVTSSYEGICYDDNDDDVSNNYSIRLLFSNVLSPTTKCPFRETAQLTNTSYKVQLTGHVKNKINK
jgi:hypothetical protein